MPKLTLPPITDAQEERIQAGIAADPDNPEITDAQFAQARPFADAFPTLAEKLRRGRGPQKAPIKQQVSLRLDRDVVARFKATGPGWQSRMNDVLRRAARDMPAA
ncbi:BrnA antitoxin family protein [Methylobacterium sp. NEAU 140]|uniref:BrnA antitoxin family protein n=1 Tax=Methylobacterium sp. NEAU 140 TaxID=3064945 RepID=UPI002737248A|nr:BrnA antitoxin family protein [Methylobacterium sp. NEAU 140]MDP4023643.1 BrnA antitoxin family protein [Methylobacterium sp. NEAU 140]